MLVECTHEKIARDMGGPIYCITRTIASAGNRFSVSWKDERVFRGVYRYRRCRNSSGQMYDGTYQPSQKLELLLLLSASTDK